MNAWLLSTWKIPLAPSYRMGVLHQVRAGSNWSSGHSVKRIECSRTVFDLLKGEIEETIGAVQPHTCCQSRAPRFSFGPEYASLRRIRSCEFLSELHRIPTKCVIRFLNQRATSNPAVSLYSAPHYETRVRNCFEQQMSGTKIRGSNWWLGLAYVLQCYMS